MCCIAPKKLDKNLRLSMSVQHIAFFSMEFSDIYRYKQK